MTYNIIVISLLKMREYNRLTYGPREGGKEESETTKTILHNRTCEPPNQQTDQNQPTKRRI